MNKVLDIVLKFNGIIGTLLGVIATLVTTQLIKGMGKIYFYFSDWESKFYGTDLIGGIQEVTNTSEAESYNYSFNLQLYNSSEIIKMLRDIKIQFEVDGKTISSIPSLQIVNINPKQIIEFTIQGYSRDENIKYLDGRYKVYFMAKNYKNKKIKKLIKVS